MFLSNVNYVAIFIASVTGMIWGAIWYAPFMFGKKWMKLVQKSENELKKGMIQAYLMSFIATLVMAYVLALMIDFSGASSIEEGIRTGFWLWLGFVATSTSMSYIFLKKPIVLYLIENGYFFFLLIIMGAILAVWV